MQLYLRTVYRGCIVAPCLAIGGVLLSTNAMQIDGYRSILTISSVAVDFTIASSSDTLRIICSGVFG